MAAPATTIANKPQHWLWQALTSTLGRKLIMALTGIFLILFLVVHLIGNLQLLKGDNGEAFNKYAYFMGHNPLIQTISWGNFSFILLHLFIGLALFIKNKASRPERYVYNNKSKVLSLSSKYMMLLGTIILVFLAGHLAQFWAKSKTGGLASIAYEGKEYHDLYTVTVDAFASPLIVGLYVFAMIALAYHLWHGFWSAFQTLGLQHKKYSPLIKLVGMAYSVVIPALYAYIPLMMYFKPW
ncbi:MAG: succinate dehydrogenase cytochrome b subunit [Verrucomicrobia bacterium]|nr:succinate dehydrogenase cytochrome b subunit [Cytophagales bacterium]